MKKFLTLLLSCLLLFSVTLSTACAQYHDPVLNGENNTSTPENPNGGSTGGSLDAMTPFTVTLTVQQIDGEMEELNLEGVYAVWKNSYSEFRAPFSQEGVASCKGPDGDYRVTLSKTPAGYTYDPNLYSADNNERDITIVLYPIREFSRGDGYDKDTPYQILLSGVYRLKFEQDAQELYFQLNPNITGSFQIRSLIDVVANEVTPTLTTYANFMFMYPRRHANTGASGTYTQNFDITLGIGTSQDYSFSIHVAASRPDVYPIYVDVIMSRVGDYDFEPPYEVVPVPELAQARNESGTFQPMSKNDSGRIISLDESRVVYNDTDGYYHYGSATGPLLYACISVDSEMIATRTGRGLLDPEGRYTRCGNVQLDYTDFVNAIANKSNSHGRYPVTKELKEYLYNVSVSKNFFWDGYGFAESAGYSSPDKDQWLWACGYYK